jgi:hypothetical protein
MQINAGSFVLCSRRFCSPASSVSRRRLQARSAVRVNDCPRVPIGLSRGRLAPIEGVTVTCWKKEGDEFRAAMRERDRSNIGRMARLRGAVETASSPPAWPGILLGNRKVKSHVAGVAASTCQHCRDTSNLTIIRNFATIAVPHPWRGRWWRN